MKNWAPFLFVLMMIPIQNCCAEVLRGNPRTSAIVSPQSSSTASGAELNRELEPPQSCPIDANDIAEPLTVDGLKTLMFRYVWTSVCNNKFRSALENIFALENRNERWATTLEEAVGTAARELSGVTVTGGCHASLCRYSVKLTESAKLASQHAFEHRVIDLVKDNKFAVDSIHFGPLSNHITYFYSTVLPAAFIGPLRRIMEASSNVREREPVATESPLASPAAGKSAH